jgi:hypothetical protein
MKTFIQTYEYILTKVSFISKQLKLKISKSTGRPLALPPENVIALSIWKQSNGIPTKKAIWKIFNLKSSYKTFVVQVNRLAIYALLILNILLKLNQKNAHLVKHTDSTDIPVCLNKNARYHKVIQGFATWGHSGKGLYYELKMSITTDLKRKLLAVKFTSGDGDDRKTFLKMNESLIGIFVADAGYISKDLEKEFYIENKRILFAKLRANMKKIITPFQYRLYNTRMLIELNFRNLKMFKGLITSLPKSINGYLANYVYSLLAHVLE